MVQHVAGCKAEQPNSSSKQSVLAAVVLGKAGPMGTSVVLESQLVLGVIEVRPAEKSTTGIVQRDLRHWTG
jgi:hypothetical protein